MIGKIKGLGLAFVAIVALSAMAASAAQASQFHISKAGQPFAPSTITATSEVGQEPSLKVQNTAKTATLQVKCQTATLEGTNTVATPDEITTTATYGIGKGDPAEVQNCTLAGLKAQVLMNGCKYTITGTHTPTGGVAETASPLGLTAYVDITGCTAGKKIEVKSALAACTLTVGEQNTISHIVFTNESPVGAPKQVTANATASGITVTQDGAGCPDGNGHTGTSGVFAASTIIKAFEDPGTEQKTLHGHQYTAHKCGAQIDIQAT
jgi:hypothetical protein